MYSKLTRVTAGLAALAFATACTPETSNEMAYQARLMECARENGFTMLAAHRAGFGPGYAENAISSITRNASLGVLYAEVDVAESVDGVLYLMHDWTLDRTTTGTGEIREAEWSYIETLSLVDPDGQTLEEGVPTLDSAISAAREAGVYLNLDLKNVSEETLVAAIERLDAADQVIVIAYSVEDAARLHTLNPNLVLSAPNDPEALDAAGVNLDNVYLWLGVVEPDAAEDQALAEQGLEAAAGLFPLEVGDPALYRTAASTGVEVLSIDDVLTGSSALGGPDVLSAQIQTCRNAAD
ncbi:MAG: glycerophosphodiester phosphodiesterase family protein [Maricaulis sp.]|jgi:glycerophosphoryl diester phosphodiesterase|uniref:glycerophosphodiester phosphodiesterase family protein n=1 Tax=Maricaulis sp. TaxID=1486257 RepID=UPI001B12B566|nr:glycerophosphodiester phosphodiesterase family protein [Maricaulis sp.]MBO6728413.1 glycerophosphodiester phosphodiesterase family protein [Maricaulis sp.]MBO6846449.1 glycerophosphodiester phosphodiesterase family protein [Maricaulis sp.]MBO6876680.1 glycerophosphodiester phosphodiesterase family protein [Maricaulis sp.]